MEVPLEILPVLVGFLSESVTEVPLDVPIAENPENPLIVPLEAPLEVLPKNLPETNQPLAESLLNKDKIIKKKNLRFFSGRFTRRFSRRSSKSFH